MRRERVAWFLLAMGLGIFSVPARADWGGAYTCSYTNSGGDPSDKCNIGFGTLRGRTEAECSASATLAGCSRVTTILFNLPCTPISTSAGGCVGKDSTGAGAATGQGALTPGGQVGFTLPGLGDLQNSSLNPHHWMKDLDSVSKYLDKKLAALRQKYADVKKKGWKAAFDPYRDLRAENTSESAKSVRLRQKVRSQYVLAKKDKKTPDTPEEETPKKRKKHKDHRPETPRDGGRDLASAKGKLDPEAVKGFCQTFPKAWACQASGNGKRGLAAFQKAVKDCERGKAGISPDLCPKIPNQIYLTDDHRGTAPGTMRSKDYNYGSTSAPPPPGSGPANGGGPQMAGPSGKRSPKQHVHRGRDWKENDAAKEDKPVAVSDPKCINGKTPLGQLCNAAKTGVAATKAKTNEEAAATAGSAFDGNRVPAAEGGN